jgi:hypothetical protein
LVSDTPAKSVETKPAEPKKPSEVKASQPKVRKPAAPVDSLQGFMSSLSGLGTMLTVQARDALAVAAEAVGVVPPEALSRPGTDVEPPASAAQPSAQTPTPAENVTAPAEEAKTVPTVDARTDAEGTGARALKPAPVAPAADGPVTTANATAPPGVLDARASISCEWHSGNVEAVVGIAFPWAAEQGTAASPTTWEDNFALLQKEHTHILHERQRAIDAEQAEQERLYDECVAPFAEKVLELFDKLDADDSGGTCLVAISLPPFLLR